MERLLNFEAPLDIALLDAVVGAFYSSDKTQMETADAVLTQFQEHPQAWTRIMPILTTSQDSNSRFFALRILERVIKTSWKDLNDQRESIMTTVVVMLANKLILQKCNQLLVQILVREFPNWGDFIQNLLASATTSTVSCQNCMEILKLLGEELIERSSADGQLPDNVRNQIEQQPYQDLCYIVKEMGSLLSMSSGNLLLASIVLEALGSYLDLVPISHIVSSISLDFVIVMLSQPLCRVSAAKWLIDFVTVVHTKRDKLDMSVLVGLFSRVMAQVAAIVPCQQEASFDFLRDINRFCKSAPKFVQNLSVFFVIILKEFAALNTSDAGFVQNVNTAHSYLFLFSLLHNKQVVKICLDYWFFLLTKVYKARQTQGAEITSTLAKALLPAVCHCRPPDVKLKISFRVIKGIEEVTIEEMEEGEEVDDDEDEEDLSSLYKKFREIYVLLAHIYPKETGDLVLQGLQVLASGQWSAASMCGLSWVIACVGEAFCEADQQQLLSPVLAQLLVMRNSVAAGNNTARTLMCACLLHILLQSPRFVQSHPVLQSAVTTCFECMTESSIGVKNMACHTLLFIARTCRAQLCTVPIAKPEASGQITLAEYIVNAVLQMSVQGGVNQAQMLLLYQAIGYALSGFIDPPHLAQQQLLINRTLETATDAINLYYGVGKNTLRVKDTINGIVRAIQVHAAVAAPLRALYSEQFKMIFQDLVRIYTVYCEIPADVVQQGPSGVRGAYASGLRVKREILRLFVVFSEGCPDADAQGFIQQLSALNFQQSALNDFAVAPAETKPVDLITLATVWAKRGHLTSESATAILYGLLKASMQVLPDNYDNLVPLAVAIWKLVIVFCENYTIALFTADFQTFFEAMLWGTLHQHKTSSEKAMTVLRSLLQHIPQLPPNIQTVFLQNYYSQLLRHVMTMLVNVQNMALFSFVSTSLFMLACFARDHSEQGYIDLITAALESPTTSKEGLRVAFDPLTSTLDLTAFKRLLRDFTIKLQPFTTVSTFDMWREEQERQAEVEKEERHTFLKSIPGMEIPSE